MTNLPVAIVQRRARLPEIIHQRQAQYFAAALNSGLVGSLGLGKANYGLGDIGAGGGGNLRVERQGSIL